MEPPHPHHTKENLRNKIDVTLKQWERLFKMDFKTKLYVTKSIWQ